MRFASGIFLNSYPVFLLHNGVIYRKVPSSKAPEAAPLWSPHLLDFTALQFFLNLLNLFPPSISDTANSPAPAGPWRRHSNVLRTYSQGFCPPVKELQPHPLSVTDRGMSMGRGPAKQGFITLGWVTLCYGARLCCVVPMFSRIPSLYPLNASSTALVLRMKNVSRCCQLPLGK